MYYSNIYKTSIVDGPGVRVSMYVSGCRNHCLGCHNQKSWNFTFGHEYTNKAESEIIRLVGMPYISGFTAVGGEPMEEENQRVLVKLFKKLKEQYPQKNIWCYTGYEFDDLLHRKHCEVTDELLSYIDVLVVGPFILDERDISDDNRWRGSRNQRCIDVHDTLREKHPVFVKGIPNND